MDSIEQGLLDRARQGDHRAMEEIIVRYEQPVAATVTGILGFSPEVDDIGQETFVRFFRAMGRFRGDSRIGTYIIRIAINLSRTELKRRKRFAGWPEAEFSDGANAVPRSGRSPEADGDSRSLVRKGLQRLEPKFRTVVVLRLISGYSTQETAKILRLPQGTVLSRLSRGQAKLREIIEELSCRHHDGDREREMIEKERDGQTAQAQQDHR
jgi:RNA polymerase sigma-70 factor (ECF subfamily)